MHSPSEQERLELIAKDPHYGRGPNGDMVRYSFLVFKRYIRGPEVLEMGPGEGIMTELLKAAHFGLTVVEGSKLLCESLAKRFPSITVDQSLFEDYLPRQQFDTIVLGHVLEHVDDPVAILKIAKKWLNPGGRILAASPNARSIHRQAAVIMGILKAEDELSPADHLHGHRRVYNPETFRQDFLAAGLNIEIFGGYWLKPVSNRQIEESWNSEMLTAFMQLGERYPDIAGELYIVATHP